MAAFAAMTERGVVALIVSDGIRSAQPAMQRRIKLRVVAASSPRYLKPHPRIKKPIHHVLQQPRDVVLEPAHRQAAAEGD